MTSAAGHSATAGSWLRRFTPVDRPRWRLVCLPHAGGTARAFAGWSALLPEDVEVIAVQYPGRQDRITEPCVTDMAELADRLTAALAPLVDLPMRIFGHSMGSAVAFEVALRLADEHDYRPERIFVSARTTPAQRPGEDNHRLNDADLVAAIRALGGPDADVYDFPKLWPIILPPLRADLRLLDKHRPRSMRRLASPITALGGDADHTCPPEDLRHWKDATNAEFEMRIFPGGHHYFTANEEEIGRLLGAGPLHTENARPELSTGFRELGTPLERGIGTIWAEHLGVTGIGADDDFFELGGHSLIGMKIIEAIRAEFGVEVPALAFYMRPTPAGVAAVIDTVRGAS